MIKRLARTNSHLLFRLSHRRLCLIDLRLRLLHAEFQIHVIEPHDRLAALNIAAHLYGD